MCSSPLYYKLLSIVSSFNLTQIVTEPTRISKTTSTLIDLIFVSPSVKVKLCSTIPPLANADHLGLHLIVTASSLTRKPKPVTRKILRYALADFDRAMELLDTVEWTSTLSHDVNVYWSNWKTSFLQIMEMCIPNAVVKLKRNLPWMNNEISQAIKKRNSLFRIAKSSGKPADRERYTVKRNQTTALLRKSKQSFFNKLNNADAKTFWKSVRSLNHKPTSMPTLQHNGTKLETSESKADALNNYFYTCFFPPLTDSDFSYDDLHPDNCPKELLCTEATTVTLLANLDTTKSTGCDSVNANMLKSTAESTASSLSTLFNLSISTGVFPTEWKTARIVPIPKGDNQTVLSGYRPISVLPIASKVLERHVKSIIEDYLQEHSPISPRQWGFVSSRSTVSALIKVVDDCLQALDNGYEVCMIFFDIHKAFDTVPHLLLLHTFEELGLDKYLLRWLKNYLFNRTQYVAVEGDESHILPVLSGVPQGSVLGPLLFICYINEVVSAISCSSQINLFADDMVLYRIIKSSADYLQLQQDIDSVTSCIRSKHLKFNTSKCRQMFISRKRVHSIAPPSFTIDGSPLIEVMEYKYLGVTLTSDMTWSSHISNVCIKSRKLVGLLYRRFYRNSSSHTLLKLYKSFI